MSIYANYRACAGKPEISAALKVRARLSLTPSLYGPAIGRWAHDRNVTPGVDLSQYNYKVDFKALKAAGVKFVVLRSSIGNDWIDPTFAPRCQEAYDNDLMVMAYHVIVPNLIDNIPGNTAVQMPIIRKALENKQVYALWIDNEIIKDVNNKPIAPSWVSDRTKDLLNTCKKEFGARLNNNIGMYSAKWVFDYAPAMNNWAHLFPYWGAFYPYDAGSVVTTWEELDAKWYPSQTVSIPLPGIVEKMAIWQFSGDRFKLPGCYANDKGDLSAIDLNLIPLPWDEFCKMYKYTPRGSTTPEQQEQPPVTDNNEQLDRIEAAQAALAAQLARIEAEIKKPVNFTITGSGTKIN